MEEYDVMVTEAKQYIYNVEAKSKEEAVKKVYKEYYSLQNQLGDDDSISIDFEVDGEEIDINIESSKDYGIN